MLAPLLFAAIQVIAPADGAVLRGGRFTTLTWAADQLPGNAEEWEAFMSVDGGKFYSVRLTPHLDIDIRRFDVLIPNVDSDDVRILIRTGDERNETIMAMPQRLRIRAEAAAIVPVSFGGHGPESARPNEPLVVQWSVGDHVETAAAPASLQAISKPSHRSIEITIAKHHVEGRFSPPDRLEPVPHSDPPQQQRPADVLLQSSRMNV